MLVACDCIYFTVLLIACRLAREQSVSLYVAVGQADAFVELESLCILKSAINILRSINLNKQQHHACLSYHTLADYPK